MRVSAQGPEGAGRREAPAAWPVRIDAPVGTPSEKVERAVEAAIGIVWAATCRRFPGVFPATIRYLGPQTEMLDLSQAFAYPVQSIVAIRQIAPDRTVSTFDEDSWRFDPPHFLVRQDDDTGTTYFPCQNPFRAVTYPGSWWIEAMIGLDPPADVLRAAEFMAAELLLADTDPENCSLPDKVRSITRQGTTIEFDRTLWSGVPLMQEITEPYPKGHGCGVADFEFGRDPAAMANPTYPKARLAGWAYRSWKGRWWAEVPDAAVPAP